MNAFRDAHGAGRAEAEAADWLAKRERGLTAAEQERFSDWILADGRNAEAVERLEQAWRFLQRPRHTGQAEAVLQGVEARVAGRRRRSALRAASLAGLAAAAAAAVVLAILEPSAVRSWLGVGGPAASAVVRPEARTLADGSVVELNAGAEIEASFTAGVRAVRLLGGEAHFIVAKDAARPFVVTAGALSVRAVGTEFAVSLAPSEVAVLVTEGTVAVAPTAARVAEAPAAPVQALALLTAGNRTSAPATGADAAPLRVVAVEPEALRAAQAWRSLRVEFTAMPLREVVRRFNGHNRLQLALASPELGALRISGIFRLDDPEGFARLVESGAGLRASRDAADRILFDQL